MLAGEISSTRKSQEFVTTCSITAGVTGSNITVTPFTLYYKGSLSVDWGDGSKTYVYSTSSTTSRAFTHIYNLQPNSITYNIKIKGNVNLITRINLSYPSSATMSQLQKLTSLQEFYANGNSAYPQEDWTFDINQLPSKLGTFSITYSSYSRNTTYGTVSSSTIFPNLTYLKVGGYNKISGDIANLFGTVPDGWGYYNSPGPGANYGPDIKLPNLTRLDIIGLNTLSGNIECFARGNNGYIIQWPMTYIAFGGNNTITGDVSQFQYLPNLTDINVSGNNTIYGDIVFYNVRYVTILGNNTIGGDISGLGIYAPDIIRIWIQGRNTITGDIIYLPNTLNYIWIDGFNTISGDIWNISDSVTDFIINGHNQLYGDIQNLYLKPNLTNFTVGGYNTIGGDIIGLADSNLRRFSISGSNTVYGDIQYFPSTMVSGVSITSLTSNHDSGYLYGDIASLNISTFFIINATNSITGDIGDISPNIYNFTLYKNTTKLTYTTRTWPSSKLSELHLEPGPGAGLTTEEVDQLLIDLQRDYAVPAGGKIWLKGNNAAPSALSYTARSILITRAITLTIN